MATDISSVFSPPINEQRWMSQLKATLKSEVIIEFFPNPTIFQVPKVMTETKPEAYTPKLLGLGPYHHLRPELFIMNNEKLLLWKKCFSPEVIPELDVSPVVRVNYDKYLDLEGYTIQCILYIDALYLLHFLGRYEVNTESENLNPIHRELAKDVIMLENQIPSFGLQNIGKELGLFSLDRRTSVDLLYSQLYYYFCKAHSPFELASRKSRCSKLGSTHLLAHMYHLIMSHDVDIRYGEPLPLNSEVIDNGRECLCILKELGLGQDPYEFAFMSLQVLENKKEKREEKKKIIVQKVEIPSASELYKKYKIHFVARADAGIKNITFYNGGNNEVGKLVLDLPVINFRCDVTEVVLRNLIAYEAAVKSTLELAEYVDLMCGLVRTPNDVALLRDKGIVKGHLNDEQVAVIFNGINKSTGESKEESTSRRVVKEVMEVLKNWDREMNKQKFGFFHFPSFVVFSHLRLSSLSDRRRLRRLLKSRSTRDNNSSQP